MYRSQGEEKDQTPTEENGEIVGQYDQETDCIAPELLSKCSQTCGL
jgi:hypothetical protein